MEARWETMAAILRRQHKRYYVPTRIRFKILDKTEPKQQN